MIISEIISSSLISIIFILGLGFLLKNVIREWLVTRIRSGIQNDFDTQLATHKAKLALQIEESKLKLSNDLQVQKTFLDTVRSSFSEGQKLSMERKLAAVDKIWDEVLQLRKLTQPAMSVVDTFKVSEVDKFRKVWESDLGASFLQGNSVEATKEKPQTISSDLEATRPFIGEYLRNLLNCYRTIHWRMYFVLRMFSDDPAGVIGWFTDKGTYGIVAAVLNEKELEDFDRLQFGKFTWLIDKLESKMLAELRNIVSGQHFAQDALEKIDDAAIKRMKQAVASTQNDARAT